MRGSKNPTTSIDHPVGHLAHAQTSGEAELLLLLLAWVRMIRVPMQPGLEVVGGLLGELPALALGTIDQLGLLDGTGRRAGASIGDDRGGIGSHGRRIMAVTWRQNVLARRELPFVFGAWNGPALVLTGDARLAGEKLLLLLLGSNRATERSVTHGIVVLGRRAAQLAWG